MRHGLAGGPATSDALRSLTPAGEREVEQVAAAAALRIEALDVIRHSHRLRAQQTATLLARTLAPRMGIAQMEGLDSGDEPEFLFHALADEPEKLMLVTHLPFVGHLAGLLLTRDANRTPIVFGPATLACLRGVGSEWELLWIERPGG